VIEDVRIIRPAVSFTVGCGEFNGGNKAAGRAALNREERPPDGCRAGRRQRAERAKEAQEEPEQDEP
jgi:hypothetical protein